MKKKDLVPGTIYSTKWPSPHMLLSTGIWRESRSYGPERRYLLMNKTSKPQKSTGFLDTGQGVLTLVGDHGTMQMLKRDHADLLQQIADITPQDGGAPTDHTEVVTTLLDLLKDARKFADSKCYIRLENYQRWAGTYEEMAENERQRSRETHAALKELDEVRAKASARAERTEQRLVSVLGENRAFLRARKRVTSSDGGQDSYVPSGLELNFGVLDQLLELAEKGKAAE